MPRHAPGAAQQGFTRTTEGRVLILQSNSAGDLRYAGESSIYEGTITVPESVEGLSLQVLAMDAANANFGIFERPFNELGRGQSSD